MLLPMLLLEIIITLASVTAASMLLVVVVYPMAEATAVPSLVVVVPHVADVAVVSIFMVLVHPDPSARFATNLVIMPALVTNALIKLLRMNLNLHCKPFTPLPIYLLMRAGTQIQEPLTTSLMT
jgi:hypothetical protein